MMNAIIMGPPGVGKGTFSKLTADHFRIHPISTGDILRNTDTELGRQAQEIIAQGYLIPDDVMCELVRTTIAFAKQRGFILDGFPRNIQQVMDLEDILTDFQIKLDVVINLDVPEEILLSRVLNRRVCPQCHQVFNLSKDDLSAGRCLKCGADIVQRDDDRSKEIFVHRLGIFQELSPPIIEFYRQKNLLVDFSPVTDDTTANFRELLRIINKE